MMLPTLARVTGLMVLDVSTAWAARHAGLPDGLDDPHDVIHPTSHGNLKMDFGGTTSGPDNAFNFGEGNGGCLSRKRYRGGAAGKVYRIDNT